VEGDNVLRGNAFHGKKRPMMNENGLLAKPREKRFNLARKVPWPFGRGKNRAEG